MSLRFVTRYYVRSTLITAAIALSALVSVGCASASSVAAGATRVPFASLAKGGPEGPQFLAHLPAVIEFREGDVLPFELAVNSMLVAQDPKPARVSFVVKRRFFLLMRSDAPPRVSLDGVDFDTPARGSFGVGLGVTAEGAKGTATIGWWAEDAAP